MFKANNKNVNFPTQFCVENISYRFGATGSIELCLKGSVWNFFSVDYSAINKSDMLKIYKLSMAKKTRKQRSGLLKTYL